MTVEERLRALAESLPTNGSVVLTRSDLEELLGPIETTPSQNGLGEADLTVAEVADRLNRTPQTIRDWIKTGKLRAYKFHGREYRVTPAALVAFEDRQRHGAPKREVLSERVPLNKWRSRGP